MAPTEKLQSSLPGLKYPTLRDTAIKCSALWLEGKKADDGAEGLWRVHDHLYDLSGWVHQHPGGADWIQLTKGTDITEAFEAYHISTLPEKLLSNYRVRKATGRRNSPYTFKEDGFYRTLKRKVRLELGHSHSGPTRESKMVADILLACTLASATLAAAMGSYCTGALAGAMLALTLIAAHNFFHQRDNIRMHYFNMSFMSARDWRVSHGLSHHIYPNSLLDLEVTIFEPFFYWLPYTKKDWRSRYLSWIYSPIIYSAMFHSQLLLREDLDWGLCQLDAVRERKEVNTCTALALVTFGHHSLHHLFPSLDHALLHKLYPVLEDTCRQFGTKCEVSTLWGMLCGQFLQLARNVPNTRHGVARPLSQQ